MVDLGIGETLQLVHRERAERANKMQRSRSRSPRRDDYDRRSRTPSRDRYRSSRRDRSPVNGHRDESGGGYDRRGPPAPRNHEDRQVAKEQMMSNIRESSQQDRRVYVGNLSYDVKWHHLKDFMRKCKLYNTTNTLQISSR